jgi:S1-C subfamily serine protease
MMERKVRILLFIFVSLNLVFVGITGYALFKGYINLGSLMSLQNQSKNGQESIRVEVLVPPSIETGTEFFIRLHVINDGSVPIQMFWIRIDALIIQASPVKKVFPLPVQNMTGIDASTYEFSLELKPGEVVDFVFTMEAWSNPGEVRGNIEVKASEASGIAMVNYSILSFNPHDPPPTPTWIPPSEVIPYESIVQISVMRKVGGVLEVAWSGSGSIISTDGLILTSARAVLPRKNYPVDALMVSLSLQPNQPPKLMFRAVVVQADEAIDLAVILVNADKEGKAIDGSTLNLHAASLGRYENLSSGSRLNILGFDQMNSRNVELAEAEVEVISAGRIFIKTTLTGGFSGGLAANEAGELVGIPTQSGFRSENQFSNCQAIIDSNRDKKIDNFDDCAPTGGLIDTLLPINLALPLIDAARRGEVNLVDSERPESELPAQGKVLLFDDFSYAQSGWQVFDDNEGWGEYSNDQFRIQVKDEDTLLYSILKENFGDVILQLETGVVSPTGFGDRGVICRYKGEGSYYLLAISEDGYYGIFKREKERMIALIDWKFSELVPRYTPAVMKVVLGQVVDGSYVDGGVGLSAGTWDIAGFVAFFDDLEIRKP